MTPVSTPSVPQHCPSPRELDDLELLASGALAPIKAFNEPGSPVTLDLPADVSLRPRPLAPSSWSTPRACPSPSSPCPTGGSSR